LGAEAEECDIAFRHLSNKYSFTHNCYASTAASQASQMLAGWWPVSTVGGITRQRNTIAPPRGRGCRRAGRRRTAPGRCAAWSVQLLRPLPRSPDLVRPLTLSACWSRAARTIALILFSNSTYHSHKENCRGGSDVVVREGVATRCGLDSAQGPGGLSVVRTSHVPVLERLGSDIMRLCARHSATRGDGATQSNHRTFKFISRPKTSTSRHIYTELQSKDIKPQCDFARSVRGWRG